MPPSERSAADHQRARAVRRGAAGAAGLCRTRSACCPRTRPPWWRRPPADAVLVDARRELVHAKSLCRLLQATGPGLPALRGRDRGRASSRSAPTGASTTCILAHRRPRRGRGPAAAGHRPPRRRHGRRGAAARSAPASWSSTRPPTRPGCAAAPLDLTYKEFELLKYLAQHPGRVFTRAQLLQEVWGYDYFGGTRTVDVHVRRLRAKLGPEHESLIGTVRNVGYRFVPVRATGDGRRARQGYETTSAADDHDDSMTESRDHRRRTYRRPGR